MMVAVCVIQCGIKTQWHIAQREFTVAEHGVFIFNNYCRVGYGGSEWISDKKCVIHV